jgi:tetratricopeptide (TPR) repeat protein
VLVGGLGVPTGWAQAANSISTAEDWLLVRTENFDVLTNTDSERAKLIAYKLEQYRYVISLLAPQLMTHLPKPSKVNVFRDGSSYTNGLPSLLNRTVVAGYFQPGNNTIAINDLYNIGDNISFHEYTHLLARQEPIEYPLWFSEGIAEFYETFEIQGDRAYIGEISTPRLHVLQNIDFIPLRKLLSFRNYKQVLESTAIDNFYAESWLLTHYLMANGSRRSQLQEFLRLSRDNQPLEVAFRQAFQQDFEAMEQALQNYLAAGNYNVVSLRFDLDKVESDIAIFSLAEEEALAKVTQALASESPVQRLDLVLQAKSTKLPLPTSVCALIPDFEAIAEIVGLRTTLSKRPTRLVSGDAKMTAQVREAMNEFRLANELYNKGLVDEALAKYERSVVLDPEFAPAYANIGNIYASKKLYDLARLAYEKGRVVAPNYAGTYLNLAVTQYEQGHKDAAEASFRAALSLYPSSAAAYLGLANIHLERREFQRARGEYVKTLNLVRGRGAEALNAHIGLGAIYFYLGEYEKAKEQYRQAIQLDPRNAVWHRAYADNCRMLKQYDQAKTAYEQALTLNEDDAKSRESLEWLRRIAEYQTRVKASLPSAKPSSVAEKSPPTNKNKKILSGN